MTTRIGPGYMVVDGVRLAILEAGPLDADTTFVLVHGWGSSSGAWDRLIPELAPEHRVLAVDLRGHGGSEVGEEAVTIERIVTDLGVVLEMAGVEQPIVIGHSLGGTIATAYGLTNRAARGVVVIDPSYGADESEMAGTSARLEDYRRHGGLTPARGIAGGFAARANPSLLLSAQHALLCAQPRALSELFESNYLAPGAVGAEPGTRAWLGQRTVPTLALFPSEYRARVDLAAGGASVEVWEGAGHFLHQEQPERFAALVRAWAPNLH
ncbi:MAG: alpha/beta hydrolase [Nocardioides sp.]|uniref:alpha/beta fold hydrolase n=1 Tax=Nocardioides sp. TaxID=35761 RepID=UPI0039E6E2EA